MSLYSTTSGEGAQEVVFLHGLYGQGRNFTTIARGIEDLATSHLVDLPNHGRSPWTVTFTLDDQADVVAAWLRETFQAPVSLVSHSLGGKIAMRLALRHPELVARLMVVDISPAETPASLSLGPLVAALRNLDLQRVGSRSDADDLLRPEIEEDVVRGFLLQNLRRQAGSWHWMANLDLLGDNLHIVSGWPPIDGQWHGPTYWVAGGESDYIQDHHQPAMRDYFPQTRSLTMKNAGHWVHAEVPGPFTQVVRHFLTEEEPLSPE